MHTLEDDFSKAHRFRLFDRIGLAVFGITFFVWLPSLWNDFVEWDDLNMIVQNPRLNPPTWAGTAWYWFHPAWNLYQPLTTTAWAALARLGWVDAPDSFGGHMNPAVFHLASLALHATSTFLLYQIGRLALRNSPAAAMGALLFGVHPLQTEAVAFAGALNTVLAGTFLLFAIWQYLVLTDPQASSSARPSRIVRWTVASLALLLAMLAKPTAVVTAPIAFVLDRAIHRRSFRPAVRSILPWILLELPCVIWTHQFQHGSHAAHSPLWFRPVIASDSAWFFIRQIFWPAHLGIDYGRTPQFLLSSRYSSLALIAPLILLAIVLITQRRLPLIAAGLAIFIIGLLPNSGLLPFDFQLFSTVADRYVYLGLVGVAIALGAVIYRWPCIKLIVAGILVALAIRTQFQIVTWRNGQVLFENALRVNPQSWMSAANLASVITDRSPEQAIALCRQSIRLRDDRSDVWNTLGSALMVKGDQPQAIEAFETAVRLAPDNPLFAANLARAKADIHRRRPGNADEPPAQTMGPAR